MTRKLFSGVLRNHQYSPVLQDAAVEAERQQAQVFAKKTQTRPRSVIATALKPLEAQA